MYLHSLIEKKKSWNLPMPMFKQQNIELRIHSSEIYHGTLQIKVEGGVFFECYVESLKGILCCEAFWIEGLNPAVRYTIDPSLLRENYIYEDMLTFYYPGGISEISFAICVESKTKNELTLTDGRELTSFAHGIEVNKKQHTAVKQRLNPHNSLITLKEPLIKITGLKGTYHPSEVIQLTIDSKLPHMTQMTLQFDEEFVVPKRLDIFVKEKWTQEWFVKKKGFEHFLLKLMGKGEHKKKVILSVYIENQTEAYVEYELFITPYEKYESTIQIDNLYAYRLLRIHIFKQYIESLLNRKMDKFLSDSIVACLNFNQNDLEMRLFYIWYLLETGHKKDARVELQLLIKYTSKAQENGYKQTIDGLQKIIDNQHILELEQEEPLEVDSFWLYHMVKIRMLKAYQVGYGYFEELVKRGDRSSFLIAECVVLLNRTPSIPKEDDSFYMLCLHWAINHQSISKEWLLKLDRYYYTLEKNCLFTSHLAIKIYLLQPTPNILKLVCFRCITEGLHTEQAYTYYLMALEQNLLIPNLEVDYIRCCYALGKTLKLDYVTQIQKLDSELKEFVLLTLVNNRMHHGALYKRWYQEILRSITEQTNMTSGIYHMIRLLFHELVVEKKAFIISLVSPFRVKALVDDLYGFEILNAIIHMCLTINRYFDFEQSEQMLNNIVEAIGFEGVLLCYENHEAVYRYFFMTDNIRSHSLLFLPLEIYKMNIFKQPMEHKFLIQILKDDYLDAIVETYSMLKNDPNVRALKTSMEYYNQIFFNYVGSKIAAEGVYVDESILEQLYEYTLQSGFEEIGLIYALLKGIDPSKNSWMTKLENVYNLAIKHDIIQPWQKSLPNFDSMNVIEFLSSESDDVRIHYRYKEDTHFCIAPMRHIGFGVFIYNIKLFYGEYLDYYIVKHHKGSYHIPHSGVVYQEYLTMGENTASHHQVNIALDLIAQAYELDDYQSATVLIEEEVQFVKRMLSIPRI